ncbi:uncharacterized protein TRAVEDRAFT_22582 [Trametes versicolor FP-101664 SS1]|uniref:uncharacterized protein n=1 Tax=Trametes versicolor (strain FP-101664) TaxID=717944 RepID=UPI000462467A|nr:uncharacterized protein TRAVEDRAFT_22582 [Trametes versicolor FP-101664 SS1]EIW54654.1 hypothetical protein TRAVEDRAFT_22582 [Trametes versicolor FP-101664 SS1]
MHNESQPNDDSSVEEQVIVYLNSDTARQAIHKDIDNLGKNIETINALFDKVMRPLQAFDHQSPDGKSVLATQWAAFRKVVPATGIQPLVYSIVYTEAVLGKVKALNCDVSTLMTEIGRLREVTTMAARRHAAI